MERYNEAQNSSSNKALLAFIDLRLKDEPSTNEKDQDCPNNLCEALMQRTATNPINKPAAFARPMLPDCDSRAYDRSDTPASEGNVFSNSTYDLWKKNAEFQPNSSTTARLCLEGCPEKAERMRLQTEDMYDDD